MAVALRYLTEFGKHAFQHTTASICGGIYARVVVFCSTSTVRCRRKESSRSLSHLLMSFVYCWYDGVVDRSVHVAGIPEHKRGEWRAASWPDAVPVSDGLCQHDLLRRNWLRPEPKQRNVLADHTSCRRRTNAAVQWRYTLRAYQKRRLSVLGWIYLCY